MQEFSGGLILNVNDDESSRYAVTRILENDGFRVIEASSGADALETARRNPVSIVVLDVRLPDMSGFEVCTRLKSDAITQFVPVLHLTAHALQTEHKVRSLQTGADAYLTFPLEPAFFLATVRSLLRLRRAEEERRSLLDLERSRAERLERALAELQRERRIREQFIATLTHDLRSPLTAIRMCANLVARRIDDPEHVLRQCGRITASVVRADQMIQDLLDASRIRAGEGIPLKLEPVDLCDLARETIEELASIHGERFRFECSEPRLELRADRSGLKRILENLMVNAVKYGAAEAPVSLAIRRREEEVAIEVHNSGNPIPESQLTSLWDPFRRVPSADVGPKQGWGLGLTLVKGMAEAHGGRVRVRSSVDEGTTFSVELPAAAAARLVHLA
jgi:signal transduction histidine kinase